MIPVTRQLTDDDLRTLADHFLNQRWRSIEVATRRLDGADGQAHPLELCYRGAALLHLDQPAAAHHCLGLARSLAPQDRMIAFYLGRTLLAKGDVGGSLPLLQQAHRQFPLQQDSAAAYWYVRALLQAGDRDGAAYVRATALAFHPEDPHLLALRPQPQATDQSQQAAQASRGSGPRHRLEADGHSPGNDCLALLVLDARTVLCRGHASRSVQSLPGDSPLQLHATIQWHPPARLRLQALLEHPSGSGRDGHHLWARFQLPPAAIEQGLQLLNTASYCLQIGRELCRPGQLIDCRDRPWPQSAEDVLEALQLEAVPLQLARRWLDAVIGPALVDLHRHAAEVSRWQATDLPRQRLSFGACVRDTPAEPIPPEVSILIPLYRRWDFIRAQIAAFALDPGINNGRVELIYVCDDPGIEAELLRWCRSQGHHAGLPFQVVLQPRNQGFAASLNLAARLAQGAMLCFVNSDVLPCAAGWLDLLLSAWRDHPDVAITTGLLLYPDGSLQHAGMESISRAEFPGLRLNHHPGKGLMWRGGERPRPIPLCSGALMLLERREFLGLGGFRTDFIRGDFEDSDLCLQLQRRGRHCLLVPSARLWHGERQSLPDREAGEERLHQWRVLANAWLAEQPASPRAR